jgi:hypothetical protein
MLVEVVQLFPHTIFTLNAQQSIGTVDGIIFWISSSCIDLCSSSFLLDPNFNYDLVKEAMGI